MTRTEDWPLAKSVERTKALSPTILEGVTPAHNHTSELMRSFSLEASN